MNSILKLVAVEFSLSQKCFHVGDVEDMLKCNIESILRRKAGDYMVIGLFHTYEQASAYVDQARKVLKMDQYTVYQTAEGNMIVNSEHP